MPSINGIVLPQTEKVGVIYNSDGPINDGWFSWNYFYIFIVAILVIIIICMLCYLLYLLTCSSSSSSSNTNNSCNTTNITCKKPITNANKEPPCKLITEFKDDNGTGFHEYKIERTVYVPKSGSCDSVANSSINLNNDLIDDSNANTCEPLISQKQNQQRSIVIPITESKSNPIASIPSSMKSNDKMSLNRLDRLPTPPDSSNSSYSSLQSSSQPNYNTDISEPRSILTLSKSPSPGSQTNSQFDYPSQQQQSNISSNYPSQQQQQQQIQQTLLRTNTNENIEKAKTLASKRSTESQLAQNMQNKLNSVSPIDTMETNYLRSDLSLNSK